MVEGGRGACRGVSQLLEEGVGRVSVDKGGRHKAEGHAGRELSHA